METFDNNARPLKMMKACTFAALVSAVRVATAVAVWGQCGGIGYSGRCVRPPRESERTTLKSLLVQHGLRRGDYL